MQNFNTNQTRFLYVAGAIDANVDTNLDIALGQMATGEMFFKYKNSEGLVTRSDSFDPKKIVSLKKTTYDKLAKPLVAHVVAVNTSAVTLANLVGKTVNLIITVHQAFDYDDDNCIRIVASVVGDATNTATAAAFHKALAIAIAKALPKMGDPLYPYFKVYSSGSEVTAATDASSVNGASAGVVLVESAQKWSRGKLTGEPCKLSVAFHYAASNTEDIVWGSDAVSTVAAVNTAQTTSISPVSISGAYELANLEHFAAGEKGDYIRGFNYPNEYEFVPAITDLTKNYDVLSIEYYWQGAAENIVKSPRLIQVVAEHNNTPASDICTQLYDAIDAAMNNVASS